MKINGTRVMVVLAALVVMFIYVQVPVPSVVVEAPPMVQVAAAQADGGATVVADVVYPLTIGEIVAIALAVMAFLGVVATWFKAGTGNLGALDASVAAQLSQTNVNVLATFEKMFDKMDERHQATLRQVVAVTGMAASWTPAQSDDAMVGLLNEVTDGQPVKEKQASSMVTPGGEVGGGAADATAPTEAEPKGASAADMVAQAVRAANVEKKPEKPSADPGKIGRRPRR